MPGFAIFGIALFSFFSLAGDPHMAVVADWIGNDTSELPTGPDYLCTQVQFIDKSLRVIMVVKESYLVRKTKRVAMTETRHVPLASIKKIAILEDRAHPDWERRYMVLIHYATPKGSKVYLRQESGNEVFAQLQAFTLGTYTYPQANKIKNGLKLLSKTAGVAIE